MCVLATRVKSFWKLRHIILRGFLFRFVETERTRAVGTAWDCTAGMEAKFRVVQGRKKNSVGRQPPHCFACEEAHDREDDVAEDASTRASSLSVSAMMRHASSRTSETLSWSKSIGRSVTSSSGV